MDSKNATNEAAAVVVHSNETTREDGESDNHAMMQTADAAPEDLETNHHTNAEESDDDQGQNQVNDDEEEEEEKDEEEEEEEDNIDDRNEHDQWKNYDKRLNEGGSDDEDDKEEVDEDDENDEADENDEEEESNGSNSDGESDGESASSSSENEDSKPAAPVLGEDGRVLSAYEIMRLERIRRNQEYLAKLGLDSIKEQQQQDLQEQQQKRRRKSVDNAMPEKQRLSRRAKAAVDYSEPSISIAALLRESKKEETAEAKPIKEKKVSLDHSEQQQSRPKKGKPRRDRMERFIYDEFCVIQNHKKRVLKEAEKNVRLAEKEVKFWSKRMEKVLRQEERRAERQRILDEMDARMKAAAAAAAAAASAVAEPDPVIEEDMGLSNKQIKELMKEVLDRKDELNEAVAQYDEEFRAEERAREREAMRIEADTRIATLSALHRFPKALKVRKQMRLGLFFSGL